MSRIDIAKAAGKEVAELADEILSSDGDVKVYEDEMERLRINAASIILRAIELAAIPAETLDQEMLAHARYRTHDCNPAACSPCAKLDAALRAARSEGGKP